MNLAKTRSGNRHAVCGLLLIVNTYIHTYKHYDDFFEELVDKGYKKTLENGAAAQLCRTYSNEPNCSGMIFIYFRACKLSLHNVPTFCEK